MRFTSLALVSILLTTACSERQEFYLGPPQEPPAKGVFQNWLIDDEEGTVLSFADKKAGQEFDFQITETDGSPSCIFKLVINGAAKAGIMLLDKATFDTAQTPCTQIQIVVPYFWEQQTNKLTICPQIIAKEGTPLFPFASNVSCLTATALQ